MLLQAQLGLNGGKVIMSECILSLNFIYSNYKGVLSAIIACPDTDLSMNKCEILGNQTVLTIGVFSRYANLLIEKSRKSTTTLNEPV